MKFFIGKIIYPACAIFTVICILFSGILSLSDSAMDVPTINLGNVLQILFFSLIAAACGLIFQSRIPKIPAALLHFLGLSADVIVVFFLIGGHCSSFSQGAKLMLVFAVIYFVIASVIFTVRHFSGKKETDGSYERQFR